MVPHASLIVTTYNWVAALDQVLASLAVQTEPNFEVIVADDGSRNDTRHAIQAWQSCFPVPLKHCWQEDQGFRAAAIRNRAVLLAESNYLIFLDGDCVVRSSFVQKHLRLAKPGWFVAGNRVLCQEAFIPRPQKSLGYWLVQRMKGHINRFSPLLSLPLGPLRYAQPNRWQGAKTCNLGLWIQDFKTVNGFDEQFQGWGFEDSDLVIRLQNAGICHKSGRFALPVFHLWHPEKNRNLASGNWQRLQETQQSGRILAIQGLNP
jgi:GT2 family glycosyltransferase